MKKYIKPIVGIADIQAEQFVCASKLTSGGEQEDVTAETRLRKSMDEFEDDEFVMYNEIEQANKTNGWADGLW